MRRANLIGRLFGAVLMLSIWPGTTFAWVTRYDGPGHVTDTAHDIAVDESGNVYVTGQSDGGGTLSDYATVKYDADGNELWVARYDGPGHGDDIANAMRVDSDGNGYVTGQSDGGGTLSDYATVKYDADGNQLWVAHYNGPGHGNDTAHDIAVDDSGNVYVTGQSDGGGTLSDYATVKYDGDGNQLWVVRYDGPGHGDDIAKAMTVGSDGNVYVTGESDGGGTYIDYATAKYDTDGNELWVVRYEGPGDYDAPDGAEAIVVDDSGNVYVTGESVGYRTFLDYATVKYDADGDELWVARYDGPGSYGPSPYDDYDSPSAMALDDAGNVYVTGTSDGGGTLSDDATVKYDAAGNELWVARYSGLHMLYGVTAMAVDGSGNVYVTGDSSPSMGGTWVPDYATVMYSAGGNQLWVARYNGPDNYADVALAMVVDDSGNVYVTGRSSGTLYDYATVKYSPGQCNDNDNDGYGEPASPACTYPEEDCFDSNPEVNPAGAAEGPVDDPTCSDIVDNDCDGHVDLADSGCRPPACIDNDGDGYGNPASSACPQPQLDCNDNDPNVNPGMTELPGNGIDDDCNAATPPYGTPASVLGTEYERSSGITNTVLIFLPLGAIIFLRIRLRKK